MDKLDHIAEQVSAMSAKQNRLISDVSEMRTKVDDISKWKNECDAGRKILLWIVGSLGAAGASWMLFAAKVKGWFQ